MKLSPPRGLDLYPFLCLACTISSAWLLRKPVDADPAFGAMPGRPAVVGLTWLVAASGFVPAILLDLPRHRTLATSAFVGSAVLFLPGMVRDPDTSAALASPLPSEYATAFNLSLALLAFAWAYPRLERDLTPGLRRIVSRGARIAIAGWYLLLILSTIVLLR